MLAIPFFAGCALMPQQPPGMDKVIAQPAPSNKPPKSAWVKPLPDKPDTQGKTLEEVLASSQNADSASRTQAKVIDITPLSGYSDEWAAGNGAGGDFSGSYTRVVITSHVYSEGNVLSNGQAAAASSNQVAYPYQSRIWPVRAMFGKEFSVNLTAKISAGALEQTVPLVTIGHSSNSDGEKWSRAVHHDSSGFPLFLVKTNGNASVPRVQFSVKASNTYTSRGAAAALGVTVQMAKALSSAPSVVTKLTSDTMKTEANALDAAISQLFGSALTEEHWTDRDLKKWALTDNNPGGVLIEFSIPRDESDFQSTPMPIGKWRISFDYPRPSIFVDWHICDDTKPRCKKTAALAKTQVVADLSVGEVLNYKLIPANTELSSIRAYISSLDWYNASVTAFATQTGNALDATASAFCRRIVNEITDLGLNGFDASAVLWAVYRGMPAAFPDLPKNPSCKSLLQDFAAK